MSDPIYVIPQRRIMDCGVCALAMLLGVGYEAANDAVIAVVGAKGAGRGLYLKELEAAALHLKRPLSRTRVYDIEAATGILSLRGGDRWHYAVLKEGQIIDPDPGMVWNVHTYLTTQKLKAHTLLRLLPRDPQQDSSE